MNKENRNEKIPNALLIGAQKAGTTSLFDWIAQHPQVLSSPAVKDFPYFWHDENYDKGVSELTRFFPERHDEKVVLAGNVNDMFFEQSAARIKTLNPEMRLIVCLRNPVERAYSAYNYAVQRGLEGRSFAEAITQELGEVEAVDIVTQSQKYYVSHGYYWSQIRRILDCFDRRQMHVVLFEDIREKPKQTMQEIFRFLEVDDAFVPNFAKKNETKGGARFGKLNELLFSYALKQPKWYRCVKGAISPNLRFVMRGIIDKVNRKAIAIPPLDLRSVELLRIHYQEEVNNLSAFLGRNLDGWLK